MFVAEQAKTRFEVLTLECGRPEKMYVSLPYVDLMPVDFNTTMIYHSYA